MLHVLHGAYDSRFDQVNFSCICEGGESIAGFDFVPYPEQGLVKKRPSLGRRYPKLRWSKRRQSKAVFGECSKRARRLIADQRAAASCF